MTVSLNGERFRALVDELTELAEQRAKTECEIENASQADTSAAERALRETLEQLGRRHETETGRIEAEHRAALAEATERFESEHGATEACAFVKKVDFPPSEIDFDAAFEE